MKKIVSSLFALLLIITLVACGNNDAKDFEKVWKEDLIIFVQGDDASRVSRDLYFTVNSTTVEGAKITWKSSLPDVISINGSKGTVHRQDADVEVTLTATITIGKKTESKNFKVTVLSKDIVVAIEYNVVFEGNGGTNVPAMMKVERDKLIVKPADPVRENYTFMGWFKDEALKDQWNFATDKVTKNMTLYAKWVESNTPVETVIYKFTFSGTDFGTSYGSNQNAAKQLPNALGGSISVVLTRAAANNNAPSYKDDFLVLSASNTSTTDDFAFMEFTVDQPVTKMTFETTYWNQYAVEEVSKYVLQAKVDGNWVDLLDIQSYLAGALTYQKVTVSNLTATTYRFYAEGIDPTVGSNGGRILIDNLEIYGMEIPGQDKVAPVINGTKDMIFEVGATAPNWLDGVTATDNVDGTVAVTIESNDVNLAAKGTYSITYKAVDAAGNIARKTITVTVSENTPTPAGKLYEFNFSGTDWGTSYGSNLNVTKTLPNLLGGTVNVVLTRVAANNNHNTYTDDFLIMSGSDKRTDDPSFIEFTFDKAISSISFDAAYWGSFDVEETTKFVLEVKNGSTWTQVFDVKAALAGSLTYKKIEITGLSGTNYRLYLEGVDPAGSGSGNNGARVIIDNMVIYGEGGGSGTDTTAPVISGTSDMTFEVGATAPDWLAGITATDNVDGTVTVTIESNNVNLTAPGTYSITYKAVDAAGNIARKTITVTVGQAHGGEATLTYKFDFASTTFGNSYSSNQGTEKTVANLLGGNVTVTLTRAAANNNHGTYKDYFMVLSASNKDTENDFAIAEFAFDKAISKMTFEAAIWSQYDVQELTKFVLEVKNGSTWSQVFDIKAALDGSLAYKIITIDGLNGTNYRFYAEGTDPTGTGANGARVLIDNMNVYVGGGSGSGVDTIAPVINGANDMTFDVGATAPNWLDGVTATDNKDGSVPVVIESNSVDLGKPGSYTIVYKAVDAAGNIARKTITVTVGDAPVGDEVLTYKFDFTTTTFGTSYSGNQGTVKTVENLLGGNVNVTLTRTANNNNHGTYKDKFMVMSASNKDTDDDFAIAEFAFDKPISKITFDAAIWSQYDVQELTKFVLEVKIGSEWVQVFDINEELDGSLVYQTITIDGLDSSNYRFYAEGTDPTGTGANGARVLIDNMLVYTGNTLPVEQQDLNKDISSLQVISIYMEAGPVVLPSVGEAGSTITWAFGNPSDANNTLINLTSKTVAMPATGQVQITMVATLKNGEFEGTKTFTFVVGEGDPIAVANVRLLANGTKAKTQGVITSLFKTSTEVHFYLQDNGLGIYVVAPIALEANLVVGNEVRLIGVKNTTTQVVLNNVSKVELVGTKQFTPLALTNPTQLSSHLGKTVQLSGLLMKTYNGTENTYSLVNTLGTFDVVIPSELGATAANAIKALLANKEAGIGVQVTGAVAGTNQIVVVDSSQVQVDSAIDATLLEQVVLAYANLGALTTPVSKNITLPTTSSVINGATFVWTSNKTNVISNTGVVTQPDTETTVRLSYSLRLGGEEVETGYIDVVVLAKSTYTGYYASISGLSGTALKAELTRIISNMKNVSYDDARYILDDSDRDPNKPGNVILVYNRASVSGKWDGGVTWNREHIWPQSKLGTASKSDLHNLRPANNSINSSRGNLPFVEGSGSYGKVGSGWFPGEADKGDIARAVLYMNTRWGLSISSGTIGSLQTFIKWHNEDPVDDFEMYRNEFIYSKQNNRNPYVDHPELVAEVYGTATSTTVSSNEFEYVAYVLETTETMVVVFTELERKEFFA